MSLPPVESAWEPLPASAWDAGAARHLLQRIGFSATDAAVREALAAPLDASLKRAFTPSPPLAETPSMEKLRTLLESLQGVDAAHRRTRRDEVRDLERAGYEEFGIAWLERASAPVHSAWEKYVLFLQDVFVVAFSKVRNPVLLHRHQQTLRAGGAGSYSDLCKAVVRSPAMILYLDLQTSKAGAANENFARELFELFTLGEGAYTESDIKEAARAFTGWGVRDGESVFRRRAWDAGPKTVFGRTGAWTGDDIVDLVFERPAAATFLPRELVRFYLTDRAVDESYLEALGALWRESGYDLQTLLVRFFGSRFFFSPEFRGDQITSPTQFLLGMLQDLELDVAPFPRVTLGALRQMGQPFFNPPNVRGWLGGRHWINSATLAARRQLVDTLCTPLDKARLNGDELAALERAQAADKANVTVADPLAVLRRISAEDGAVLGRLATVAGTCLDSDARARFGAGADGGSDADARRARLVLAAVLASPRYQLC
ncbi:DUF1800 domain-containing protein [Congregicoccus parvus]|uniref:DUF1800 domain-containing protein n=1 Tax=Congregicoccus parvus TaxID=3081749 RepID=UPI003FA5C12B